MQKDMISAHDHHPADQKRIAFCGNAAIEGHLCVDSAFQSSYPFEHTSVLRALLLPTSLSTANFRRSLFMHYFQICVSLFLSFTVSAHNSSDDFFVQYPTEKIAKQLSTRLGPTDMPEVWVRKALEFLHTPQAPDFRWSDYLPSLTRICRIKLEKLLNAEILKKHGAALFRFFQKYPPFTIEGWKAYSQLTYKLYPQEYPNVLNAFLKFWTEKVFLEEKEEQIVSFLSSQISEDFRPAVQKKYQNLILKKNFRQIPQLTQLFPEFFPDLPLVALAKSMAAKSKEAEEAFARYQKLPESSKNHPLLSFGVFEFLLRKDQPDQALQEWNKHRFPHFAFLALKLSASLLAYSQKPLEQVLKQVKEILQPLIKQKEDGWYNASLALGLIWYYEGKSPTQAFPYFQKVVQAFKERALPEKKRIRLYVKALFFCGQCVRHPSFVKKNVSAKSSKEYFEQAARYPALFYGQCAAFLLNKKLVLPDMEKEKKDQIRHPVTKKVYQIASWMKKEQLKAVAQKRELKGMDAEVLKVDCQEHIHTLHEGKMFLDLFQDWSQGSMVDMARFLIYLKGFFFKQAYPRLKTQVPLLDTELIHAIIFVESRFNPYLEGDAKERGLMQVLPLSGEEAAKRLKVPFSLNKLWNQDYNLLLGNQELKRWISYFKGQYLYGIPAYNAGPYPVRRWMQKAPIHRTGNDEKDLDQMIYWIERIGYPSVRVYVETVLAAYAIYCAQKSASLSLKAWMQKPFFH